MPSFETLNAILPADAREDRQITFIEGENEQRTMSFRRLRQRATGALGALQRRGMKPGDTLILFIADNERFVEMFWACVLGGIVAVPLAPGATDEHWRKLLRVFAQLEGSLVCIDAPTLERFDTFVATHSMATDVRACARAPCSWAVLISPDSPACPCSPLRRALHSYSTRQARPATPRA